MRGQPGSCGGDLKEAFQAEHMGRDRALQMLGTPREEHCRQGDAGNKHTRVLHSGEHLWIHGLENSDPLSIKKVVINSETRRRACLPKRLTFRYTVNEKSSFQNVLLVRV